MNVKNTKLAKLRNSMNYSQEKMASKIGVSYSYYIKVENNKADASKNFMRKFKVAFPNENIDNIFFDCLQQ